MIERPDEPGAAGRAPASWYDPKRSYTDKILGTYLFVPIRL